MDSRAYNLMTAKCDKNVVDCELKMFYFNIRALSNRYPKLDR
jgi:hypothetical protein